MSSPSAFSMYKASKKKNKKKSNKLKLGLRSINGIEKESKVKNLKKRPIDANRDVFETEDDSQSSGNVFQPNATKKKKKLLKNNSNHNKLSLNVNGSESNKSPKKKMKLENRAEEIFESDEECPQLVQPHNQDSDSVTDEENDALVGPQEQNENSFVKAQKILKYFLEPISLSTFFESHWEQKPLHITRRTPEYYRHFFTSTSLDRMLRENPLYFGRNVDIVNYVDGARITEELEGRAKASLVWDRYAQGCSVRVLNPQTYDKQVNMVLATLQEYFGTMVGANIYLTPAGSQGFAPHFDDIEAFIVQLEGRKHWKLYQPKQSSDVLARFSSKDYSRDDLGELISEITLNAGDMLYFPRGVVHEAKTDDQMHSLHITISAYQRTSYADLLEKILPNALKMAANDDIQFRKGLPIGYLKHMGSANSDVDTTEREQIMRKVQSLMGKLVRYINVDEAADEMGKNFMYDSVPPVLESIEEQCTCKYDGDKLSNGVLVNRTEIAPDTEIRLLRYFCARFVEAEDKLMIYYTTENSPVYHGEEETFFSTELNMMPAAKSLMRSYPSYVTVESLPHENLIELIDFVTLLWDRGIITTKEPLEVFDEDG